jgi:DNA-binding SARP family transcriptional activator
VLGSFAVVDGGELRELPALAARLVALLAVKREPIGRLKAGSMLWPDADDNHASANVRTALWRLRAAVPNVMACQGSRLRLAPRVTVDLWAAQDAADAIGLDDVGDNGGMAMARYLSEDLLPEWDEEWLVFERERFRALRTHTLETLCRTLTGRGEYGAAIQCGLLAIQAEPLRESAYRAVTRAHMAEGNRAQAIRQVEALRAVLAEQLGAEPSAQTIELIDEVFAGV